MIALNHELHKISCYIEFLEVLRDTCQNVENLKNLHHVSESGTVDEIIKIEEILSLRGGVH